MPLLFTTSWDDGYLLDLRLADLLTQYGLTGTFYVCPKEQHDQPMLDPAQIKELSTRHEIGAHTLSHEPLTTIDVEFVENEVRGSKKWIEDTTGKPCTMFCYPYGATSGMAVKAARDAGFRGARTTEGLRFSYTNPFMMPTTVQVFPFPKRQVFTKWWHGLDTYGPLRVKKPRLKELGIPKSAWGDWLSLAKALLDYALTTNQPFFHLWGHSAEIEKYDMWVEFEAFLAYAKEKGVTAVPNSGLLR